MSVRYIWRSLAARFYARRFYNTIISERVPGPVRIGPARPDAVANVSTIARPSLQLPPASGYGLRSIGLQISYHARRLLVDNVLNRVTNSLSYELRRRAARRLMFGDSGPFFAFVGVSLASGSGILTKQDELDGVCWEIRNTTSKIIWKLDDAGIDESKLNQEIALKDLEIDESKPLGKGCNAVVYATKLREAMDGAAIKTNESTETNRSTALSHPFALKMMFNYDFKSNSMEIMRGMYKETVPARRFDNKVGPSELMQSLTEGKPHLPPHPNIVAMYSVFTDFIPDLRGSIEQYPAALPLRINPDGGLGRNMSMFLLMKRYDNSLDKFLKENKEQLNIRYSILMFAQLLEAIAHLKGHKIAHRDLKSDNILLDHSDDGTCPILVVSDFGCCLADEKIGLHLPYNSKEVMKEGNAALMAPEVILKKPGTFSVIDYSKADLWAAGAIAYEIFGEPNPFYPKDKYTPATMRNVDYNEDDLPPLPDTVPFIIQCLVKSMLVRNPSKRISTEMAANVCQLFLWAPSAWIRGEDAKIPRNSEILQWLLCLTTKVLCEGRLANIQFSQISKSKIENPSTSTQPETFTASESNANLSRGRRTFPEYLLIASFLRRAHLDQIRRAIQWIHNVQY